MVGGFIQGSQSPINRGNVRGIALAIYTTIGLHYMMGSLDLSVPLCVISPLARPDPAFYLSSNVLLLTFLPGQ